MIICNYDSKAHVDRHNSEKYINVYYITRFMSYGHSPSRECVLFIE